MFCQQCGTELLSSAYFCPNCGAKIINDSANGQPHVGATQTHEDMYAENKYTAYKQYEWQPERTEDEQRLMKSYLYGKAPFCSVVLAEQK